MTMDPVGQEFRKGTARTSHLCYAMPGASSRKTQIAGGDLTAGGWHHLKVYLLTSLVVLADCWLGLQHMASPCEGFLTPRWPGSKSTPGEPGWSCAIMISALEVTHSINSTLITNPSSSRGRNTGYNPQMLSYMECQLLCKKRGKGEILVSIFGNYKVPHWA